MVLRVREGWPSDEAEAEAEGDADVAGLIGVDEGMTQAGSVQVTVTELVLVMTDVIGEVKTLVMLPEVIVCPAGHVVTVV